MVRIAGESGEGVISTGELVAQAAARAGYELLTFKTYPAEIKGGHTLIQLRLSDRRLYTQGDQLDVLLAFNQEAYDKNVADLKPGGLLIYDSAEFTPPESGDRQQYAVPLTEIARSQLKFELGKNVVAVGVVAALFDLPKEQLVRLLQEKFGRKGEDVVAKNVAALEAGIRYVQDQMGGKPLFAVGAAEHRGEMVVVSGNQALAMGAIAAGCRNYFGYPITPATDIMEFLAAHLSKVGGSVVQAEDEIAAAGMVLGASYGGVRAMTATSGPGLSLMVEMLGLGAMAELPAVVVDVQRAGPSTGMPTKHEQGDLKLAVSGGHGEVPRIVLAPTSVEDCFWQAINAFNLAEQYQMPVILLSDTVLATRTEKIPRPDLSKVELKGRLLYQADGSGNGHEGGRFKRYSFTATGVSPMSVPGQAGGQYVATGLEHGELGRPRYDPDTHSRMTEKRFRKLAAAAADAPPADLYGDPSAEIGIVTWGSTMGAVVEAVDLAREKGIAVEALAPRMLWPIPDRQVGEFVRSKKVLIVPEVNYSGQFADLLAARYKRDVVKLSSYGGTPIKVARIVKAIEEVGQHVG
ncbi:MAG: 2-oxoacid:acceptor oxidoreductase subunit alpha [Chloroflexi bacterium]|nr:2-oxoacid:acceptor oxidoreductase subunit alpha [Chloroflexota bacterium]